jgi:hypothetical protein
MFSDRTRDSPLCQAPEPSRIVSRPIDPFQRHPHILRIAAARPKAQQFFCYRLAGRNNPLRQGTASLVREHLPRQIGLPIKGCYVRAHDAAMAAQQFDHL